MTKKKDPRGPSSKKIENLLCQTTGLVRVVHVARNKDSVYRKFFGRKFGFMAEAQYLYASKSIDGERYHCTLCHLGLPSVRGCGDNPFYIKCLGLRDELRKGLCLLLSYLHLN